ncbi:MAG TPA: 50S ribosomal protein L25 [Ignavibacteriaceae bacterium]|nr:50S ribosomal protein L25 [Ignavibacteriaceae bacterium]
MEKSILEAEVREIGSKQARKLVRNSGKVPGIYYSKHDSPVHLAVSEKAINPLVYTAETHLVSLKVDGKELDCVIKDVQFDPITDRVVHFDLIGLTSGETFQLEVPVQLHGTPVGIKEGGIVQHLIHKIELECLPKDIPQRIDIDISELKIGDSIHVKDLKIENITFLNPEDSVIVSVSHPKVEKEPVEGEEAAGEEQAEPEVIGKGKGEEEEE